MAGSSSDAQTSINSQSVPVMIPPTHPENSDESTPLLSSSSRASGTSACSKHILEACAISVVFIVGITIGFYLLIIEGEEPPSRFPFDLIERTEWGASGQVQGPQLNRTLVDHVLVFHTRGERCEGSWKCGQVLRSLQREYRRRNHTDVPHNFLISDRGQTYEAQGWLYQSDFHELLERNVSLAVGFLGNFTAQSPKRSQLEETRSFINEAIRRGRLRRNFGVYVVRNLSIHPQDATALINAVKLWPNWRRVIEYS
ncbi:hypothetical protein DMENIID0001_171300 [Sergentomyia squamirostris]